MNFEHGYTITELCKQLKISRETYYRYFRERNISKYTKEKQSFDAAVRIAIFEIYRQSGTKRKGIYGSRKIREILSTYIINKKQVRLSRHQVLRIMKKMELKSKYNSKSFKPYSNKTKAHFYYDNLLEQRFDNYKPLEVITSDLTYVKTGKGWRYVCFIIDLFNREIIGHAISKYHDSNCVLRALASIKFDLNNTRIFHSDRGGEFASCELSEYLKQLNIVQSMSRAGCPYDNAVSENMFKLLKVEGIDRYYQFDSNLILDVNEWVKWYNNVRIHSKINNKSPVMYREQHELKAV